MSEPEPSAAWLDEIGRTTGAVLLAVLDQDQEGLNAILRTCTLSECVHVAVSLARAIIACCREEDRPGMRDSLAQLLQGLHELEA